MNHLNKIYKIYKTKITKNKNDPKIFMILLILLVFKIVALCLTNLVNKIMINSKFFTWLFEQSISQYTSFLNVFPVWKTMHIKGNKCHIVTQTKIRMQNKLKILVKCKYKLKMFLDGVQTKIYFTTLFFVRELAEVWKELPIVCFKFPQSPGKCKKGIKWN